MDMSQSTRKWSELHGIAVISVADGKKIGTCDDFYFDPITQSVYALQVKTSLFGHKVLPVSYISAFGQDAITIASEEGLRSKSEDERVATLPSGQSLHSYKVMSASGTLVGTVGNVLLDTSTPTALKIAAFELARSLRERLGGRYPTFPAAQVVGYGQDVPVHHLMAACCYCGYPSPAVLPPRSAASARPPPAASDERFRLVPSPVLPRVW